MKKLSVVLALVLVFSLLIVQTPGVKADSLNYWAKSYGGSGTDVINDVKVLQDGSIIAVGYTTSFGAGGKDVLIMKLNPDGDIIWAKAYGGTNDDVANEVAIASNGNIIVAGYTKSFGAGKKDVWILRLDTEGGIIWQKTYGGDGQDEASSIAVAPNGDIIVAGYTTSFGYYYAVWVLKLDFNGKVTWARIFRGYHPNGVSDIALTSGEGIVLCGVNNDEDAFVMKLNQNGDVAWAKSYGGSGTDVINDVKVLQDGSIIAVGYTTSFGAGGKDVLIMKLNPDGDIIWAKAYGGTNDDVANEVAIASNGNIIVAGYTKSFGDNQRDVLILKLSAHGDVNWTRTYGGNSDDGYWDVNVDVTLNNNIIIGSDTESFGVGGADAWVLHIPLEGDMPGCNFCHEFNISLSGTNLLAQSSQMFPTTLIIATGNTNIYPKLGDLEVTIQYSVVSLTITSSPSGASVYIDGSYEGTTPLVLNISPGIHSIQITKQEYNDYKRNITLVPGKGKVLSVILIPKFGHLTVYSTPTNAEVYVDEDYIGKTPLKGYKLSTGTHTIKLVKDGYEDYVKTVKINPGETTKIEATLLEAKATLKITSDPSEASVYVDDSYKGTTPLTLQLSPGTHSVKLSKNDYEDYTTSVTLNPGESKTISATLTPTFGYLSIDSTPQGAKVYIDDSYVGDTPLKDYKLPTGEHTVKVVMDGYEEFTKTVTINSGEKVSIEAGLIATQTASTTSSITTETSQVGSTATISKSTANSQPLTKSTSTIVPSSPTQTARAIATGIPATYIAVGLLVLGLIGGAAVKLRGGKASGGVTPTPEATFKPVTNFPSELLSKYEPFEFLGEGGFAKVFKVKRKSDGKIIALKVPNLDEKARKFFLKEVKAWRLLDHPNIVKLYNAFDEPVPHLEIEFVDGIKPDGKIIRDLGKYPKPVDEEKALNLIRGIARGLKHAHSKQVYHRDLKPQNVLITSDLTPKITDWGLAKVGAVSTTATTTKGLTLLYAAPEQLDEEVYGHTDHRTDIYQLGLIFYELLTGKLPYQGTSPAVVMAKVINPEVKPKPPSHFDKKLAKYDGIFEKLLAKRKEDRYQSVDEFLKDLELMRKLDEERKALEKTVEKTKTTMSLTTDSKELRKLKRQVVEQLTRLALLHAQLNDKAELINALEDLKALSKEHRKEIENAIGQFELMMRESVPVSKSTLDELKVLLHKVQKEVEG